MDSRGISLGSDLLNFQNLMNIENTIGERLKKLMGACLFHCGIRIPLLLIVMAAS